LAKFIFALLRLYMILCKVILLMIQIIILLLTY
jgi:hypothetical protein